MSLQEDFEALEEKYYGEWEEAREPLIEALSPLYRADLEANDRQYSDFSREVINYFGGAFIPYIFWTELDAFSRDNERRVNLFAIIEAFINSDFEETERKQMKPLVITYFTMEKEFEMDKLFATVIKGTHPDVESYFQKLFDFVDKNKTSVEMYIEKFNLLQGIYPDFGLLRLPVTKLKEKLAVS